MKGGYIGKSLANAKESFVQFFFFWISSCLWRLWWFNELHLRFTAVANLPEIQSANLNNSNHVPSCDSRNGTANKFIRPMVETRMMQGKADGNFPRTCPSQLECSWRRRQQEQHLAGGGECCVPHRAVLVASCSYDCD